MGYRIYERKPLMIRYEKSLLALTASVLSHYGVPTKHATLPEADALLRKNYQNVVVLLFDGMGCNALRRHLREDSFLRRHCHGTLCSVFPPTTTAATTTAESGLSPIEHGWLGWTLRFREVDANVSAFSNVLAGTDGTPAADYPLARTHLAYKTVFEQIREATGGRVAAHHVSNFSTTSPRHYDTAEALCHAVGELCRGGGRKFVYGYWNQPDYDMHDYGVDHPRIAADLTEIDATVKALAERLTDTLLIVTADHGLINTEWRFLSDYPAILDCLTRAPSVEPRAMSLFVKDSERERFETLFSQAFGDAYILCTRERILAEGYFGDGTPHPRVADFIGDYVAIATGNVSIEPCAPRTEDMFRAAHAGLTAEEMEIPFVVIER